MKFRAPQLAVLFSTLLFFMLSGLVNTGCKTSTEVVESDAGGDTTGGNDANTSDNTIGTQYQLKLFDQNRKMVGLSEDLLKVQYLEDGQPVNGVTIMYTLSTTDSAIAKLQVLESTTQVDGTAQVKVSVGAGPATFTVSVQDKDKRAAPQQFTIEIVPKEQAELTVKLKYEGVRNNAQLADVQTVEVYIYKKGGEFSTCDKFDFKTATANKLKNVPSQPLIQSPIPEAAFAGFLAADYGEYLVYGQGVNADGAVLVSGCLDTGAAVGTQPVTVELLLKDNLPTYTGKYDMKLSIDLLSALKTVNETAYNVVNSIVLFFNNPTAALLNLTCIIPNATLNDLCDTLFECEEQGKEPPCEVKTDINGVPTPKNTLVSLVTEALNEVLNGLFAQNAILGSVINIGGSISSMIKGLKLEGVMEITKQPVPNNGKLVFPDDAITINFTGVRYKWVVEQSDGSQKPVEGLLSSTQISGEPFISGIFKGYVESLYDFTLEDGPVDLNYGVIINAVLEKVVLKELAGVETYEDFIKELLGGKGCSSATQVNQTCCYKLATQISCGDTPGDAPNCTLFGTVDTACKVLIDTAAIFLRDQLNNLSIGSASDAGCGEGFCFSSPVGKPCKLWDDFGGKSDNIIDRFGKPDAQCMMEGKISIKQDDGSTTIVPWDVDFFANRQGQE